MERYVAAGISQNAFLPGGSSRPLESVLRGAAWLVAFSYRQTFFFDRRLWILGLAGAVFLGLVMVGAGMPMLALFLPFLLLLCTLSGLIARSIFLRSPKLPILAIVSRLAPATVTADGTSRNHQRALVEVVEEGGNGLADWAEARRLEPLSQAQAERVMAEGTARILFYGEVRVEGDFWMAKGGILIDGPPPPAAERDVAPPPRHEGFEDLERQRRELVSKQAAPHMRVFEAELLNLIASEYAAEP